MVIEPGILCCIFNLNISEFSTKLLPLAHSQDIIIIRKAQLCVLHMNDLFSCFLYTAVAALFGHCNFVVLYVRTLLKSSLIIEYVTL